MKVWYIYVEQRKDRDGRLYQTHRYYRKKLHPCPAELEYVGQAELTERYFLLGYETQQTDIISLADIELEYTAMLKNGPARFRHTLDDLLYRAKEGILPYISFKGFQVIGKPRLVIKGKMHELRNPVQLEIGD